MADQSSPTVVALVTDLFFSVRLGNEIRRAGYAPRIVKTLDAFVEGLNAGQVVLGIIDLGARFELSALSTLTEPSHSSGVPIIAFGPHKNVDAFRQAKAAGLTRVMSNSQFHTQTVEMIQRYASNGTTETEP